MNKNFSKLFLDFVVKYKKLFLPFFKKFVHICGKNSAYLTFLLALYESRKADYNNADALFDQQISKAKSPAKRVSLARKRITCWTLAGNKAKTTAALRYYLELDPDNMPYRKKLLETGTGSPLWLQIEEFREFLQLNPKDKTIRQKYAVALYNMNRFAESAAVYEGLIADYPNEKVFLYNGAKSYDDGGFEDQAAETFALALDAYFPKNKTRHLLGRGLLYSRNKNWPRALRAFRTYHERFPESNAILPYLGEAAAHCMEWEEAIVSYRLFFEKADRAQCPLHHWFFCIALEKEDYLDEAIAEYAYATADIKKWGAAIDAYRKNSKRIEDNKVHEIYYRLGCILDKQNKAKDAAEAFVQAAQTLQFPKTQRLSILMAELKGQEPSAEQHYALGLSYEALLNWEKAAHHYQCATDRRQNHNHAYYYRLGHALYQQGLYKEAVQAFKEMRVYYKRATLALLKADTPKALLNVMLYQEACDTLPIRENVIFYESFHGFNMNCNPYAIFKNLLNDPTYSNYLHVWSLEDQSLMIHEYRNHPRVIYTKRESELFFKYLASAKYLINNVTFLFNFSRRPEQKYLHTWHGTPLKFLCKDICDPKELMPHANPARNLLHATHVINPNKHTQTAYIEGSEVSKIMTAKQAITGYPRVDLLLNASHEEKASYKNKLGLQEENTLPTVLYAPTWRSEGSAVSSSYADVKQIVADIQRLSTIKCNLIFRGHHVLERLIQEQKLPVTMASSTVIDASELLSITDVLITDYSSIFFDFLPTKKPILFYAYDLEEYQTKRGGLYFDMHDMPGELCLTQEELVYSLQKTLKTKFQPDAKYEQALKTFCPKDDGHATERVIDFFFNDNFTDIEITPGSSLPSVLFFIGHFIPNGVTASFLNRMNCIDKRKFNIVLALPHTDTISNDPQKVSRFRQFDRQHAQIVNRRGIQAFTLEEKMVADFHNSYVLQPSQALEQAQENNYRREFSRVFGRTKFDYIINCEGYSTFWARLFAYAEATYSKKIFLHNDMVQESVVRFPYLNLNFKIYNRYDYLASVSSGVNDSNYENLSPTLSIPKDKFITVENAINFPEILQKSDEPLDEDISLFMGTGKTFINLARLSPEKGQEKLFRAFAATHRDFPEAKLLILGDGPLRSQLTTVIAELKMQEHIKLAGLRLNPYPALKRADCSVLASNHEGQGIVLLESMLLGRPIITTDLPPTRSVMELDGGGYGLLVENSQAGLEQGMRSFLENGLSTRPFDAEAYNQRCVSQFEVLLQPRGN